MEQHRQLGYYLQQELLIPLLPKNPWPRSRPFRQMIMALRSSSLLADSRVCAGTVAKYMNLLHFQPRSVTHILFPRRSLARVPPSPPPACEAVISIGSLRPLQHVMIGCTLESVMCHSSLGRLDVAEEGVISWADKLESTSSNAMGDILEGIDCAPQTHSALSEGGGPSEDQEDDDSDDEHRCHDAASGTDIQTTNDKHSTPSSVTQTHWPRETGVKEGDTGEAVVKNVQVLPFNQDTQDLSAAQLQERDRFGWSEASCDEGSLLRKDIGQQESQVDKLQQLEEEVFEADIGRTAEDYHRRADLFGRSADQFGVQKQRDELQHNVDPKKN